MRMDLIIVVDPSIDEPERIGRTDNRVNLHVLTFVTKWILGAKSGT